MMHPCQKIQRSLAAKTSFQTSMPQSLSPFLCFLAAGLAVALCCGHVHGAIVVPDGAPQPVVWPLPQSATFGAGGPMAVSTSFVVTAAGSSQRLTAAAARYTTIIQAQVKNGRGKRGRSGLSFCACSASSHALCMCCVTQRQWMLRVCSSTRPSQASR